jgi:hypothetical protein
MTTNGNWKDRGAWAVGGGTLVGLGVGFFFITASVFAFVASLLIGIGAGLLVAALLPSRRG